MCFLMYVIAAALIIVGASQKDPRTGKPSKEGMVILAVGIIFATICTSIVVMRVCSSCNHAAIPKQ